MLLFASAKSNQKQTEGCGPLDSRGTVQNSERGDYLLKRQPSAIKNFYENLQPCAIQLGNILNRCETRVLLRKDL